MQTSRIQVLNRGLVFVSEEPGYLAVVILIAMFLALTPKAGCSFQAEPADQPAAAVEAH